MSDALKILESVGVGIYTTVGLHSYSVLASRTKSGALRALLFLIFIVFFIVGGFIGCAAIMGALYDTGQKPRPNDSNMRGLTLLSWLGIVWIYIIFNWRILKQRLKVIK
jgi:hypothetical protein